MLFSRMRIVSLIIAPLICLTTAFAAETVEYSLVKDGNVSLAIYNAEGIQVRTLMSGVPQKAGKHSITWDGRDREGKPLAKGEYTWKLLQTPGFKSEFITSIGTSTGADQWPGCHNGPAAVCVDPKRGHVYMAAGQVEGGPQIVKMTMEGKTLWSHKAYEGWGQVRDMVFTDADPGIEGKSFPDGLLYLPQTNSGNLHILDARDGSAVLSREEAKKAPEMGYRKLFGAYKRFALGGEGSPVAEGWEIVPLVAFAKDQPVGWSSLENMKVTTGEAGNSQQQDGHTFEVEGAANKHNLRSFLVKTPEGMSNCIVRLTVAGNAENVKIYSGKSYGKPRPRPNPVKTSEGDCTVLTFDTQAKKQMLDITLGNKEGVQAGWSLRGIEILVTVDRFASYGDTVLAAYSPGDRFERINPSNWTAVSETEVPDLRDLEVLSDGTILALSGEAVVQVEEKSSNHETLITGLADARCLAVDRTTGDLFVAEWGDNHQVKRFDKDYKLLNTFGRRGGREQGPYVPENFFDVADLAGDGQGGFFVVEHWAGPRRLAHFDAEGKLLKEWYGGQQFFTHGSLDSERPDRVWFDSHFGWITEAVVDWKTGEWKPRANYQLDGLGEGLLDDLGKQMGWQLRNHEGQRYLCYNVSPCMLRVDEENRRLVPVMISDSKIGAAIQKVFPGGIEGNPKGYTWIDADGDGKPQASEVRLNKWGAHGKRLHIDQDFTYYAAQTPTGKAVEGFLVRTLKPEWKNGIPVYPAFDEAPEMTLKADKSILGQLNGFYRDPSGACYLAIQMIGDGFSKRAQGPMGHGYRWPSDLVDGLAIAKWDAQGRLMWKVSGLASERLSYVRGRMNFPNGIPGMVHGMVGVTDRIILPLEMWSEDGLYAGGIFDRNPSDDTRYAWWQVKFSPSGDKGDESVANMGLLQYDMNSGGIFTEFGENQALYLGSGWNNKPAYRVTGFDSINRQQGKIQLTSEGDAARANGSGLKAEYFDNTELSGTPALERTDPQIWFGAVGKNMPEHPWTQHDLAKNAHSARWTGFIEPRFSESYRFSIYRGPAEEDGAAKVRLWVNDQLLLDAWDEAAGKEPKRRSKPIDLPAGQKAAIKLEYANPAAISLSTHLHLCWESPSQEIQHVPAGSLYLSETDSAGPIKPQPASKPQEAAKKGTTTSAPIDEAEAGSGQPDEATDAAGSGAEGIEP